MNKIENGCLAMLAAAALLATASTGSAAKLPDSAIQLAVTLNGPEGPAELARQLTAFQDDTKLDRAVTDGGSRQWQALVTWVDYNATYHSTLFDISHYRKTKTFTRVPFDLPSPWEPADLGPSFLNKADHQQANAAGRSNSPND